MKECSKCHVLKELSYFYKNKYTKDGYMSYCKECQHLTNKPQRANRMNEMRIKAGGKCVRCGYDRCLEALDFHHKDRSTKEFNIGSFKGSTQLLLNEVKKSDLICVNCHRKEEIIRNRPSLPNDNPDKICSRCKQALSYSYYDKRDDTKDGYYPMCKSCRMDYQYERRLQNKIYLLNLLGGCCIECGETDPRVLDFHHRDRSTKEFNIADKLDRSLNALEKEVLKCCILCGNCHREKHYKNNGNVV